MTKKKYSSNVVVTVIAFHHLLPDLKCAEHDHFKPVFTTYLRKYTQGSSHPEQNCIVAAVSNTQVD
jgi:hypothetical protein